MPPHDQTGQPDALPYADPRLATGGVEYRMLQYPSDRSGFWIDRIVDDGTTLSLEPGPILWRRLLGLLLIAAVIAAILLLVMSRPPHGRYRPLPMPLRIAFATALPALVFVVPYLRNAWRPRTPWIVLDRTARIVCLPRPRRSFPLASVIRLQLVTFGLVGWSRFGYRSKGRTGELQIVFVENGKEQTWCVVAWPDPDAIKQFAVAFHQASGIPVSQVTRDAAGQWTAEAFDTDS